MAAKLGTKKALPTYKFMGKDSVKALARACNVAQGKIDTIAGELGGAIAKAVEQKHLHKGAFNQIRRLVKQVEDHPGKVREFLAHFDYYREEVFDIDKLADKQADFVADDEESDDPVLASAAKKKAAKKTTKEDTKPSTKKKIKDFAKKSDKALDDAAKKVKNGNKPEDIADRAEETSEESAARIAREQESANNAGLH